MGHSDEAREILNGLLIGSLKRQVWITLVLISSNTSLLYSSSLRHHTSLAIANRLDIARRSRAKEDRASTINILFRLRRRRYGCRIVRCGSNWRCGGIRSIHLHECEQEQVMRLVSKSHSQARSYLRRYTSCILRYRRHAACRDRDKLLYADSWQWKDSRHRPALFNRLTF